MLREIAEKTSWKSNVQMIILMRMKPNQSVASVNRKMPKMNVTNVGKKSRNFVN